MADADVLIEVVDLTRRFSGCEALGGVSFQVRRGEIVGLLGPNGSGKTTLLRILASYLAPSAGRVAIAGHDVVVQSLEARGRIGYLPENVSLYLEMRVAEYLAYRGRLKGLHGERLATRIREVLARCGLADAARHVIGTLSRGHRQRTALADCLLHKPEVLLLDEPLAGLDPGQTRAMQAWWRETGRDRAVVFSTHVLADAEQFCDRVLVLNAGRLAAAEAPARLQQTTARLYAEFLAPQDDLATALQTLTGGDSCRLETRPDGWMAVSVRGAAAAGLPARLDELAQARQWPLRNVRSESRDFAEAYLRLTAPPPLVRNPSERQAG